MFALYLIDPKDGARYACTSTRRMEFSANDPPALLVDARTVEKALRDYQKHLDYCREPNSPYAWYLDRYRRGEDDLANFRVVPVTVTPEFGQEYVYKIPAKKK